MSSKLRSVIKHEYFTIVKQPSFILTMLFLPLLFVVIGVFGYIADRTSESTIEQAAEDMTNVVVVDQSGQINPTVVAALGFDFQRDNADRAIESVRAQEKDGAIIYPNNLLETRNFDVYIDGGDSFIVSSALTDIGSELVSQSLSLSLEDELLATTLREGTYGQVTAFQDGEVVSGASEYIVPGAIMAIFFVILFFTIGYMLLGVSEEKENRSMEMVLTYLRPRTLISGKLLAIGLVGLTQLVFFLALGALVYVVATQTELFTLPFDIDLTDVTFDPVTIVSGILILVFGFLMYAALMSGVAAMMPGVKEANSLSGVFYITAFVPFWVFSAILAAPESHIVRFLSFFPLTSPTTLLLRNTLGNIEGVELVLVIIALIIFTILSFFLAAKLFRLGALEFSDRVKLSSILK